MTDKLLRSQRFELEEDEGRNPSSNPTIGDVIAERLSRRDIMKGALAVTAANAAIVPLALETARAQAPANPTPSFAFKEVQAGADENIYVAEGYDADVLIRWGDPILPGAPEFDAHKQSADKQAGQFGYNNDYLGYLPIDGRSDHGLLCVNHEYTNEELMFPELPGRQDMSRPSGHNFKHMTKQLADIEMMAHGGSVIEIRKVSGKWQVVKDSKFARRITANTPMQIHGPASGHDRMKTSADPTGTRVFGMFNNCAGGRTPWGTWVTCEENINGYFWGKIDDKHPEFRGHRRMGVPSNQYNWGQYYDRFDIQKEPREANRFGWVVEIDPFDPTSTPKKRTALGRFKHEGAAGIVNKDGRYVIYSGDDERFDYIYRFVTEGRYDPANRAANMDLLDKGTLSVARFNADGSLDWLPLVHGQGPLTAANGFDSQADVVIEARRAGDMVGATKMDRPEDVEANPLTNKVYAMLTNNSRKDRCPAGRRQSPRRQPLRPYHGDDPARRRPCGVEIPLGDPGPLRRSRPSPPSARPSTRTPRRTAGSACRTIARSTRWAASGSRPTATARRALAATTASGQWRPRARRVAPPSSSSACPMARRCAALSSRRTWRRFSWPCSIPASRMTMIRMRRLRASPTSRHAGPTSRKGCRPSPRSWPSRRRAAARSGCSAEPAAML